MDTTSRKLKHKSLLVDQIAFIVDTTSLKHKHKSLLVDQRLEVHWRCELRCAIEKCCCGQLSGLLRRVLLVPIPILHAVGTWWSIVSCTWAFAA